MVLHSSDSGADVSECSKPLKLKDQKNHGKEYKSVIDQTMNCISFCSVESNQCWEKYWSDNGERLIWASWIEKYSDYINPDYINSQHMEDSKQLPNETKQSVFLEQANMSEGESKLIKSETEIIVSSCSPAANCMGDGWNTMSTGSMDDNWYAHRKFNYDPDTLLSPRCESVTSSIPFTIGTTDSMTNVTHMTISSYDFGSGGISSISSQLSESINSPDCFTSSSNSSQPVENCDESKEAILAADNAMDSDQYWQILWQSHFQEQYTKQYEEFIQNHQCELSLKYKSEAALFDGLTPTTCISSINKNPTIFSDALPLLVSNLNICSEMSANSCNTKKKTITKNPNNTQRNESDQATMTLMGLPMAFGSSKSFGTSGDGRRNPNDKPTNLKRR